jgi:hypothetical protein
MVIALLMGQRAKVPDGSTTAKSIEYRLGRWAGANPLYR